MPSDQKDFHQLQKYVTELEKDLIRLAGAGIHIHIGQIRIGELIFPDLDEPEPQFQKPILVLTTFINNQLFIMADIKLKMGTRQIGVFALVDNKTLSDLGAVFSKQKVGDAPTPGATFVLDTVDPNKVNADAVTPGAAGTVVFSADADYQDPGTAARVTASFSVTYNYTTEIVQTPDGAHLEVRFS